MTATTTTTGRAPRYHEGLPIVFRSAPETGMSGNRYLGIYVRHTMWRGVHVVAWFANGERYESVVRSSDMWPVSTPPTGEILTWRDSEVAEVERLWAESRR